VNSAWVGLYNKSAKMNLEMAWRMFLKVNPRACCFAALVLCICSVSLACHLLVSFAVMSWRFSSLWKQTNEADIRQDVNQMDTFRDSREFNFFWTPTYLNRAVGTAVKLPLTFWGIKTSSLCGGISYPTDLFCNTLPPVVRDAHSDRRLPLFSTRQRDL